MSGIFNWAVKGLYRLLSQGQFTKSQTIEEKRAVLEIQMNPLNTFINECVEFSGRAEDFTPTRDITTAFSHWCLTHSILRKIDEKDVVKGVRAWSGQTPQVLRVEGIQVRGFLGVKLTFVTPVTPVTPLLPCTVPLIKEKDELREKYKVENGHQLSHLSQASLISDKKKAEKTPNYDLNETVKRDEVPSEVKVVEQSVAEPVGLFTQLGQRCWMLMGDNENVSTDELAARVGISPDEAIRTLLSLEKGGDVFRPVPNRDVWQKVL